MAWVERFLRRNRDQLSSKYTTGIDRNRFKADTEDSYRTYFDLLHAKMRQYNVDAKNVYNMDKKGFPIGKTSRSKRIFSKQLWQQKKVTAALQDGNRDWITIMACICADGSWMDPAVIFEAKGELRDAWLRNVDPQKHQVFFTTSASGWSNNDVGLAWLEQVFQRCTKKKARRKYRILILNGHSSHLTRAFIQYCDRHKILLMVFPPHSTHSLQPLDVVVFAPLLTSYSSQLPQYLHASRGLVPVAKADFFLLFWAGYTDSFTRKNILKAFKATGVEPRDVEVVLKRFKTTTPQDFEDTETAQLGNGSTWNELRDLLRVVVTDTSKVEAKALGTAIHSLQVHNKLYCDKIDGLCGALTTRQRHKGKSKSLDLQQRKEFRSKAVFYSPSTVRESFVRKDFEQREAEEEKLQKKHQKELKAAHNLYQKQIASAKREQRQRAAEERKKEKEAKAAERVAAKVKKQQERKAATLQKPHDRANTTKQKASRSQNSNATKHRQGAAAASGEVAEPPLPSPPTKTTTRGRTIKLPDKFK
jgi:hypothetical protein